MYHFLNNDRIFYAIYLCIHCVHKYVCARVYVLVYVYHSIHAQHRTEDNLLMLVSISTM